MLIRAITSGNCLECLTPINDSEAVEHTSYLGSTHRFHRHCLLRHVKTIKKVAWLFCPACHEKLEVSTVLPWQDRNVNKLTPILKDVLISGLLVAILKQLTCLCIC